VAKVIAPDDARTLGLAGRVAREIVAAHAGSRAVTLRLVEIPAPAPGATPRGPHVHHGFEEVIHVVSGAGAFHTPDKVLRIGPGDTVLVPAEEPHVTRNTGTRPLMLLCFFPVNDIGPGTENLTGF
jgi:mannose-6-phosphate isomerase-like protein (cupin superfamily)